MKKKMLKALSMVLSTTMISAAAVIPKVSAAEVPAPVVSYNFESEAAGLTLNGDAKLTTLDGNGVLQLATSISNNKTYAKFADDAFANADFSKGMTLTIKFNPTSYVSDWSCLYTLGDSELGSDNNSKTGKCLQLTVGWTSKISYGDDLWDGYFGSGVAAPYTWDYISYPENQNKWYTLTMTVTPEEMTTYIDGVQVQTAKAGNLQTDSAFTNFLKDFNTYKQNYIGTSYYTADADVQGYVDNVAVFNTALTADQVANIDTIFNSTAPAPDNTNTVTDSAIDTTPAPDDNAAPAPDTTDDNAAPAPDNSTTTPAPEDNSQQDTTPTDDSTNSDDTDADDEATAKKAAKLNKTKASVKVGKTVKLKVKNTSKKVTWSSSNKKIAKVNKSGKVTGVKAGKATIKAKVGGKTLKCKVTVK